MSERSEINTCQLHSDRASVPLWLSIVVCGLIVLAMTYVRLVVYPTKLLPLTYGAAMLVCLWNRNIPILYTLAVFFSALATFKMVWRARYGVFGDLTYEITCIFMIMGSIWIEAAVIHSVIRSQALLEAASDKLSLKNARLEASHHELVLREAEIASQNEELQSQTEELEQQTEELRLQTQEMENQGMELRRHERALQTLLNSARWLRSDLPEQEVTGAICQAAIDVMDNGVDAAAIVQERDGRVWMRGKAGFGAQGAMNDAVMFSRSFASLIIEKKQAAYIVDLSTREDLETPQPHVGRPFVSVMAAPIWSEGRIIGAIEFYSRQTRDWTQEEFGIADWLAAQTALALQTIEYQKELEAKRREAEEASVQKTRFLAAVSHDVRTPANAISLMADLVERMSLDPSKSPQLPPMVRTLKANARALVELVSDVLDLARFDSGRLDLQITEFPLAAVVEVELRQFQHAAEHRGLKLINAAEDRRLWVRTDKTKMGRILANLIGNAVKFTEVGEIRVAAACAPDGGIHLTVSDTGMGIPAEQLPRIFDEFYQLRNPERDRNKGTGLGLAICKRLVDALGCHLSVESRPGSGTAFTIRIPAELTVQPCDEPRIAATPASDRATSRSLEDVKILLVEDHDATRAATADILASHGALVTQASSCEAGIQLLAHEQPQVLLLDMMLPDRDGTDVLRHLAAHRPESLKCVLAVSGDVRPERIDEVRRLGANDLLPKPLTTDFLIDAIVSKLSAKPQDTFLDTLSNQARITNTTIEGGLA